MASAKPAIHNKRRNKIRIHHEGGHTLIVCGVALAAIIALSCLFIDNRYVSAAVIVVFSVIYGIMVNFFRCPIRMFLGGTNNAVVAPADGKVVVVEEVEEEEYFHDKRMMVSIFMSLTNVHANWIPCDGVITKVEHHDGNFHQAFLPKASTENERSTIIIRTPHGQEVMVRQVAGAVARRIVTYAEEGSECFIDDHLGFIKFGSRVDLYLPMDAEIKVKLGQTSVGDETVIAKLASHKK